MCCHIQNMHLQANIFYANITRDIKLENWAIRTDLYFAPVLVPDTSSHSRLSIYLFD